MIYPTSLRKMLLRDVLTSAFGGFCEAFENLFGDDNVIQGFMNSFGALWNLFHTEIDFPNLFQTRICFQTKRLTAQRFWWI